MHRHLPSLSPIACVVVEQLKRFPGRTQQAEGQRKSPPTIRVDRAARLIKRGLNPMSCGAITRGVLQACYTNTAALSHKERSRCEIRIRNWSGARDLNPGPH